MNLIHSIEITSIRGRHGSGLNGLQFRDEFGGVDIFHGPNNAGKTTRLLAVWGMFLGLAEVRTDRSRPDFGDLPTDTALIVESKGGRFVRDLGAKLLTKEHKEADGEARRLFGAPVVDPFLEIFANSTAGQRGTLLDTVARAGGAIESWTAIDAQAKVRAITDTDELSACIEALPTADTGSGWLKAAEIWASKRQIDANAAQKTALAKAQGFGPAPDAPGDTDEDTARESTLHREIAEIENADKRAAESMQVLARHEEEGARLAHNLESYASEGNRYCVIADGKKRYKASDPPVPWTHPDLDRRLTDATAAMDAPIPTPGIDLDALRENVKTAEELVKKAVDLAKNTADALHDSTEAQRRAGIGFSAALIDHDRAVSNQIPSWPAPENEVCTHCGKADPMGRSAKWAEHEDEVENSRGKTLEAKERLDKAREARAIAEEAEHRASNIWREADTASVTADKALQVALVAVSSAEQAIECHAPAIRAQREEALKRAREDIEREARREKDARDKHTTNEAQRYADFLATVMRYNAAKKAVDEWTTLNAPAVVEADTGRLSELQAELDIIKARNRLRGARETHLDNARTALAGYEASKLAWEKVKLLVSAIDKARDMMAQAAYGPIHDAARQLFADIDGLPAPYFRGPDDYGAEVGGYEVAFPALGQSARLLTAAAFVYALAVVSNQPTRLVLLDGIEVIERQYRAPLMSALVRAHRSGLVDNVLLTQAGDDVEQVEGVTIHRVARDPRQIVVAHNPPQSVRHTPDIMVPIPVSAHIVSNDDVPWE